jgi:hypothetical protein
VKKESAPDFNDVLFVARLTPFLVSKLPTKVGNAVEVPDLARKNESSVSKLKFQIRHGLRGR